MPEYTVHIPYPCGTQVIYNTDLSVIGRKTRFSEGKIGLVQMVYHSDTTGENSYCIKGEPRMIAEDQIAGIA